MDRLKDKVALITGGTSGIGAETARLFIKEGARVVISGRSEEKGANLASELGEKASYIMSDITKEEDIEKAINFTTDSLGKLDILFNNAGGPVGAGLEKITQKDIGGTPSVAQTVSTGSRSVSTQATPATTTCLCVGSGRMCPSCIMPCPPRHPLKSSTSECYTPDEKIENMMVRFRTVGDITCTAPVASSADSIEKIIMETASTVITERGETRLDDQVSEASMEQRKKEGYF